MTIAQSLPLVESHVNPEIIFPEGEFWSDEPPLESNLHLQPLQYVCKTRVLPFCSGESEGDARDIWPSA